MDSTGGRGTWCAAFPEYGEKSTTPCLYSGNAAQYSGNGGSPIARKPQIEYLDPQTTHKKWISPTIILGVKPIFKGILRVQVLTISPKFVCVCDVLLWKPGRLRAQGSAPSPPCVTTSHGNMQGVLCSRLPTFRDNDTESKDGFSKTCEKTLAQPWIKKTKKHVQWLFSSNQTEATTQTSLLLGWIFRL